MTLETIRNGLYYVLTTWGPYSAEEVSTCSFDALETSAASAIIFTPGADTTFDLLTYGASGVDQMTWAIDGAVYVKDTGDPKLFLSRCWQAHDDLWQTVKKDRTLNNAAQIARITGMSFNIELGREVAGAFWGEIKFRLEAIDYD